MAGLCGSLRVLLQGRLRDIEGLIQGCYWASMTLEELHQRAQDLRREAVAFCDRVGFRQTAGDLMGNLETVHKTTAIKWAYAKHHLLSTPKSDRARNTETMRVMIERMGRAIDVYLYAKEHGVEAAMIWKLSQ
jgi:hypothetical protein